jgi:hypothetical protein
MVSSGPDDGEGQDANEIVYGVGPTVARRVLRIAMMPASLGVAALVTAFTSMLIIEAANEIGELAAVSASGNSFPLTPFRFASGIRLGVALVALALALLAARKAIGPRAQVRVTVDTLDGDSRTIDEIEAEAIAHASEPPAWVAMIVGAAVVFSLLAVAVNGADFGYALATNSPGGGSPF